MLLAPVVSHDQEVAQKFDAALVVAVGERVGSVTYWALLPGRSCHVLSSQSGSQTRVAVQPKFHWSPAHASRLVLSLRFGLAPSLISNFASQNR